MVRTWPAAICLPYDGLQSGATSGQQQRPGDARIMATARARVEADGLSAFCRFKSCPGARASEFLLASLICAGPAGGNPVCGALSFPAPALIDARQPTRLGQHAPADAPVCAPGGYYGLSQQNLRRPRFAEGTAGRAGGWDGAEPGRRDGFSGGRLYPTTKFRPGTFIPLRRGGQIGRHRHNSPIGA